MRFLRRLFGIPSVLLAPDERCVVRNDEPRRLTRRTC